MGRGIIVAVIDTGVDARHRDLAGNVLQGAVMIPGQTGDGRTDVDGHGTSMAGLIAAHGHDSSGGALGLAPEASILPIRISGGLTKGETDTQLVAAIDYAISSRVDVISISASASNDVALHQSVDRAIAAGLVIVAAASNATASLGVAFPAAYPGVIAASAVDRNGIRASVSVTGPELVLAAPGVGIVSTGLDGGYRLGTGTSDATAIIAGAAALVRARFPNLSAAEVVHRLTATATDAGPPGRDEEYGFGILNLVDALTKDVPRLTGAPTTPVAPTTSKAARGPDSGNGLPTGVLVAVVLLFLLAAAGTWTALRRRGGG